jgi:sugar/nucleoside kinase (ribokinase family)
MSDQSILVVGSIALDTIETPRGRREGLIGGSATYATIAAGRSVPVHVVGVIGTDFPAEGKAIYEQYASDLSDLKVVDGPTFKWGGRYHDNFDDRDTLFTNLGVFADFNPVLSAGNREVPWLLLANIHPALQLTVLNQNRGARRVVVDTMNLWIETTRHQLLSVLQRTDIVLLNEEEARLLSGVDDLDQAARGIQRLGPPTVVIKRGSQGVRLYHSDMVVAVGVYPVAEVVDPTGAGDTFGGGFVASLAQKATVAEALVAGSALASICVEGFGVERLLEMTAEELEQRKHHLRAALSACPTN